MWRDSSLFEVDGERADSETHATGDCCAIGSESMLATEGNRARERVLAMLPAVLVGEQT